MGVQHRRALYVLGGLCAILWPILSELVFYAATSALARGALGPAAPGMAGCATRLAQLAQVPGFLALEWGRAAVQFLLWPFLLAAFRFASQQGERDCAGLALGLGWPEAARMGAVLASFAVEQQGTQEHRLNLPEFWGRYRENFGPPPASALKQ